MEQTKKYFSFLFVLILLIDVYVASFRIIIASELLVFTALLLLGLRKFSLGFIAMVRPLIFIFLMGFVGLIYYHEYPLINVIKDITHLIKPTLAISIGYLFARLFRDYLTFIRIVVITGFLVAAVHLLRLFLFADFSTMNINAIRDVNGRDSFIELYALWFVVATPKLIRNKMFKSKLFSVVLLAVLSVSCVLYVSRAMTLAFLLLLLTYSGQSKITYRSLKAIGVLGLLIALFYTYLFSIKLDRNAHGVEAFLYKIKIAPAEILETKIDRENHVDLWDHWRGYEMKRAFALMNDKPASYVIGNGLGSVVDLKFKVDLVKDEEGMRYISMLHNGYVFVLYKTGMVGLIFLMGFLYKLYGFIYKTPYSQTHRSLLVAISSIGLFYLFSSAIISGVFIVKDSVIFILGGLLFYEIHYRKLQMERQSPFVQEVKSA